MLLNIILFSLLIPFVLIGVNEAIIKKLAVKATKHTIKDYLGPIWDRIDNQIALPGTMEEIVDKGYDWFYAAVVEETPVKLDEAYIRQITSIVIDEFDLSTFLAKKAQGLTQDK